MSGHPPAGITRDARGVPQIVGANTKVVEVVTTQQAYGWTAEKIASELPHLSLEQVQAAFAFYDSHRQEIDDDMERRLAKVERLREERGQPALVARLRAFW